MIFDADKISRDNSAMIKELVRAEGKRHILEIFRLSESDEVIRIADLHEMTSFNVALNTQILSLATVIGLLPGATPETRTASIMLFTKAILDTEARNEG